MSEPKKGKKGSKGPKEPEETKLVAAEKKDALPVLKNVNIAIREKELVAVVGSVASGKSSLCNALLGELHLVQVSLHDISVTPL
jgi:energy-coupling factor transporter ATP-binding protein EcfA2